MASTSTTTTPAAAPKLHGRAFYESIGSPKYIVAPMVDQSEFAWRMLTRSFLPPDQRSSILAYSPMFHARLFADSPRYRETHFEPIKGWGGEDAAAAAAAPETNAPHLDGHPTLDRPLFVQFCANDPDALRAAARRVAPFCDAIDLNLGCPQGIARKGHYGAFLQEDPALIARLVRTLHEDPELGVPVTAKMRVLDTPAATLQYARVLLDAGASILTVHGRQRAQKGHLTGLADWTVLRYLRENLPPDTVLFANGNVLQPADLQRCLEATGFDGVMSAEGLLSNPGLFGRSTTATEEEPLPEWWPSPDTREYWTSRDGTRSGWRVDAVMRRYLDILHVYALGETSPPVRPRLFVAGDGNDLPDEPPVPETPLSSDRKRKRDEKDKDGLSTAALTVAASPNFAAVQAHLFHLLRHAVNRHHDIRDALARSRKGDMAVYERILGMLERRVAVALADEAAAPQGEAEDERQAAEDCRVAAENNEDPLHPRDDPESSAAAVRRCRRPWWVVQPVLRPMPAEAIAKGAIQMKKKDKKAAEQAEKVEVEKTKVDTVAQA